MKYLTLAVFCAVVFFSDLSLAADLGLRAMTYNLHGYHPTGEAPRFLESRLNGELTPVQSHLFYFTPSELQRGHARRLDGLAQNLKTLLPDIVFLQEVGAGFGEANKNCDTFLKTKTENSDGPALNSAVRLANRLSAQGYSPALACRGNTGWQTYGREFENARVVKVVDGKREVVYDYKANPFPNGLIIEGMALLYRAPWMLVSNEMAQIIYNRFGGLAAVQFAVLTRKNVGKDFSILVANLHSAHKVAHFEVDVALRKAISARLNKPGAPKIDSVVLAGDMNAFTYRPNSAHANESEVSMVPLEVKVDAEYDFTAIATDFSLANLLKSLLHELNNDQIFKPWAKIVDTKQAETRIDDAVAQFQDWMRRARQQPSDETVLTEALSHVVSRQTCKPIEWGQAACSFPERIDAIFTGKKLSAKNSFILYSQDGWQTLDGFSDHPALIADFEIGQ